MHLSQFPHVRITIFLTFPPANAPVLCSGQVECLAVGLRHRTVVLIPHRPEHVVPAWREVGHIQEPADLRSGKIMLVDARIPELRHATVSVSASADRRRVGSPTRRLVCLSEIELDGSEIFARVQTRIADETKSGDYVRRAPRDQESVWRGWDWVRGKGPLGLQEDILCLSPADSSPAVPKRCAEAPVADLRVQPDRIVSDLSAQNGRWGSRAGETAH